jgi:hypothetical protein
MIAKPILCAGRLRRVPPSFSWVDHRLVRQGYLPRADEQGLSYYGEASLGRLLSLSSEEIAVARRQLEVAGVITYERPFYQVLGLDNPAWAGPRP